MAPEEPLAIRERQSPAPPAPATAPAFTETDEPALSVEFGSPSGCRPTSESGPIDVAFLVSDGASMIDFTGPWEVFQDVMIPERGTAPGDQMPFRLFTVADGGEPVRVTGGMRILPDYTPAEAPRRAWW